MFYISTNPTVVNSVLLIFSFLIHSSTAKKNVSVHSISFDLIAYAIFAHPDKLVECIEKSKWSIDDKHQQYQTVNAKWIETNIEIQQQQKTNH